MNVGVKTESSPIFLELERSNPSCAFIIVSNFKIFYKIVFFPISSIFYLLKISRYTKTYLIFADHSVEWVD